MDSQSDLLRGQLTTVEDIRQFLEAGNAILTIRSKVTQARFTFKFARPDEGPGDRANRRPVWARVLAGDGIEPTSTYQMLGTFFNVTCDGNLEYSHSRKAALSFEHPATVAVNWMFRQLYIVIDPAKRKLFEQAEVWHEGHCGRCGRRLTVPESIESGFGPECIKIVNQPF